MSIAFDLPVIWAFIIAFAVFAYVVMDGFDLGLGMLFPFFPKRDDRNVMMNSVAPVYYRARCRPDCRRRHRRSDGVRRA